MVISIKKVFLKGGNGEFYSPYKNKK